MDTGIIDGPSVPEGELGELWKAYRRRHDRRRRDRLIIHYAPVVKYVAARVASGLPRNVEVGDLISAGMFGLIDAVERFEPERGFKFETFAIPRIQGAITDELRSMDWVPRSVRARAREIESTQSTLQARLGRAPTDEELAVALDWTVDRLRNQLSKIAAAGLVAFEEVGGRDDGPGVEDNTRAPAVLLDREADREVLGQAIAECADREREVLSLYYFEGFTLAQIGEVLGVTESRVCQIHAKAMLGLRSRFKALGNAHA